MSGRRVRRTVVAAVALLALLDVVLAAVPSHRHRLAAHAHVPALSPFQAFDGPRYLLLVAGMVLLAVLPGLHAAKKNAWLVATIVSAMSAIGHHLNGLDLVGLLVAIATLLILASARASFPVPSDPPRAAQGWWLLALGELAVFAYGVGGLWLLTSEFRKSPNVFDALVGAARLLLLLPTSALAPVTHHGRWFVGSVRFLSLLVVLLALARVLAPAVVGTARRAADRRRVERLLEEWGTSTLSFFHLLPDKTWFFGHDGGLLSYHLTGRVAVVLGGPLGEPRARQQVVDEFLARCDLNGWVPAFHQVREDERDLLADRGFALLKIGEEPIVDVESFSLDVPRMKSVRSAIRRVQRTGHRVDELAQPIDDETMRELRDVSDAWLHAGGHRERTFSVGQFDPEYLRSTTVVVVRDATDRIVAFANVVPSYASAEGNFDLMRRRPGTVNGVMDFLLLGLLDHFRDEGKRGMTLGLAPLASVEGKGVVGRSLRLLGQHGSAVFNFAGLNAFKAKWATRREPRYLAYPSHLALPRIAMAVARVGETRDPSSASGRALALVQRLPFSTALIGFELWLTAATTVNPRLERFLLTRFGLNWPDLVHGQVWRIVTSVLIPPRAGLVPGDLALMCAVPILEWRLRSRRTVTVFFLGDWISSLPALAVLRMLAPFGNTAATVAVAKHDAGLSAGAYALLTMFALSLPGGSLPRGRTRTVVITLVVTSVIGPLVWYRRLFDLQHLVAVGAGWLLKPPSSPRGRSERPAAEQEDVPVGARQ